MARGLPVTRSWLAVPALPVGDICVLWGGNGTNLCLLGSPPVTQLRDVRVPPARYRPPGSRLGARADRGRPVGPRRVELHADSAGDSHRRVPRYPRGDRPGQPACDTPATLFRGGGAG